MLYRNGIIDGVDLDLSVGTPAPDANTPPQRRSPWCFFGTASKPKKPRLPISKGHKNYVLMRNLYLGIRCQCSYCYPVMEPHDLRVVDFDPREKFWMRFPLEGSKITLPHLSSEFRWKDYCPMVFRHLRKLFQVDPVDYMLAICGNEALRELSSPGKSGSFFYLTQDDRFMIKIVKKSEVKDEIKIKPQLAKYDPREIQKFYQWYYEKYVKEGPIKRKLEEMAKHYQIASVLYDVLRTIVPPEKVDNEINRYAKEVDQKKIHYAQYNILPLYGYGAKPPIIELPEIKAAVCALLKTENLSMPNVSSREDNQ